MLRAKRKKFVFIFLNLPLKQPFRDVGILARGDFFLFIGIKSPRRRTRKKYLAKIGENLEKNGIF